MSVQVVVRTRPLSKNEAAETSVVEMQGRTTLVREHGNVRTFSFDHCFGGDAPQEAVYAALGPRVLDEVFSGFNNCIFAYGQTGSGKSHTMLGTASQPGLIPRLAAALFDKAATVSASGEWTVQVHVSYLEIYNEQIRDLLAGRDDHVGASLRVREHPKTGPYVDGLQQHLVSDYMQLQLLLERGTSNRIVKATAMNDTSSRSHAIFQIFLHQTKKLTETKTTLRRSVLNLVDLAGSEKAGRMNTGEMALLKEGTNINKSLVTLGRVISELFKKVKKKQ
jgi:hypothetical protein